MNPKIASALNTLSLGLAELAEALNDSAESLPPSNAGTSVGAAPARATGTVPASELSPFEDEAVTWEPPDTLPTQDQGSEAVCPKHHVVYKSGKFGGYCPTPSEDPAWSNAKGYCTITPKSAAVWLRAQAA